MSQRKMNPIMVPTINQPSSAWGGAVHTSSTNTVSLTGSALDSRSTDSSDHDVKGPNGEGDNDPDHQSPLPFSCSDIRTPQQTFAKAMDPVLQVPRTHSISAYIHHSFFPSCYKMVYALCLIPGFDGWKVVRY